MPDNVLSDLCVLERMRLHMQGKLDVPQFSVTKLELVYNQASDRIQYSAHIH